MLVRFSTRYGQLTMFGEAGARMLKLLGHSGTIPGAIVSADLPAALASLKAGIERAGDEPAPEPGARVPTAEEIDADPRRAPVSLRTRAVPLIELIETAVARNADLMWERG
jgi:hypothetical protein